MIKLKKNERLVYAGETALRAPDGTLLPSVPQYVIVSLEEADPAAVAEIKSDERIVYAGNVNNHKQNAYERFAAMKAGREIPPKEEITALYVLLDKAQVNPKTGVPWETCGALRVLGKDLAGLISIQKRKERALEKQGVTAAV